MEKAETQAGLDVLNPAWYNADTLDANMDTKESGKRPVRAAKPSNLQDGRHGPVR